MMYAAFLTNVGKKIEIVKIIHLLPICRFFILILRGLKKHLASITVFNSIGPLTTSEPDNILIDSKLG